VGKSKASNINTFGTIVHAHYEDESGTPGDDASNTHKVPLWVSYRMPPVQAMQMPPEGYTFGHGDLDVGYPVPPNYQFANDMETILLRGCEENHGVLHRRYTYAPASKNGSDVLVFVLRFKSGRRVAQYAEWVENCTKCYIVSCVVTYNFNG